MQYLVSLLPGDGVDLLMGIHSAGLHKDGDQLMGQQIHQRIAEVAVAVLFKVRQQPPVQRRLIQSRLQVNLQAILLLAELPHMGGGRQNQGTADPKVGKQQFPKVRIDLFAALQHRQLHVPQTQSLKLGTLSTLLPQRNQRAPQRHRCVAHLPGHPMSVTGGAGGRIGYAAGGQNDPVRRKSLPCSAAHAADYAIPHLQMLRPLPQDRHMELPGPMF